MGGDNSPHILPALTSSFHMQQRCYFFLARTMYICYIHMSEDYSKDIELISTIFSLKIRTLGDHGN